MHNNVDITDEKENCSNPACLGEPWCSAWGICGAQFENAKEPTQTASQMEQQLHVNDVDSHPLEQIHSELKVC